MSSLTKNAKSISKKDLIKNRTAPIASRNVVFYHKADSGDLSINLLSLTMPSAELPTQTQATIHEINSAKLLFNRKNLKLRSLSKGELVQGLDYVVTSSYDIQLIGVYEGVGTEPDEIFEGVISSTPVSDLVVASAKSITKTYELPVGQTTLNLGNEYQVGVNPNDEVGIIKVWINGVLGIRGQDYDEVDSGNGFGSTIEFLAAPAINPYKVVVDYGVMSITDNNAIGAVENLAGSLKKIADDLSVLAGTSSSDYFNASPSEVERRAFGDTVLKIRDGLLGGTDGQVLTKSSATDFDLQWATPAGGVPVSFQLNNWTLRTPNVDNQYRTLAFGNGVFVALAASSNAIMYSRNGGDWTGATGAATAFWNGLAFGAGLFVAVGGTQIQTSPDGITWTSRTNVTGNNLVAVTFGGGQFVIVSSTGSANRVMTSPDGITWTARTTPNLQYSSVGFGNGLFVATTFQGGGAFFTTSPDGITWTNTASPQDAFWAGVAYGNGIYVAVAGFGATNKIATSSDGVTWTGRPSALGATTNDFRAILFAQGYFVAVSESGFGNRIQISTDGINWQSVASPANNGWDAIAYGNGMWVAVAETGTNRVMTSLSIGV